MLDSRCSLTLLGGSLVVKTPYDSGFVAELKALVPATQRKFDPGSKSWIVDPAQGKTIQDLIQTYFGELVLLPVIKQVKTIETKILEVRYIGACKIRGSETSAFGFMNGEWSVIFTEQVLKDWFMDSSQSVSSNQTLYNLLGINQQSNPDELKQAYRRMAKQWHPDYCKELDAADRFMQIQKAYELLSDSNKRARYDAGLALEASVNNQRVEINSLGLYRSPLRCGLILANGYESLGRFNTTQILAWDDIVDRSGRTLVTSWPMGAMRPVEVWI